MSPIPQALLDAEKQLVSEAKAEDKAARAALSVPMPGPLRDVFAIQPNIDVGIYKIRPFVDFDFEVLQQINHPIVIDPTIMKNNGRRAWQLIWILTHDPDEVELSIKDGSFDTKARQEFGKYQLAAVLQLMTAVLEQFKIYWSTSIPYGGSESDSNPPESSMTSKQTV